MAWIISITAGAWQTYAIKTAASLGYKVFAVDGTPTAAGFNFADHTLCCDIFDTERIVSACNEINITPKGVSSFTSEAGMIPAAKIRDYYDLSGIRFNNVKYFIDKCAQRAIWDEHHLPNPKWISATSFGNAVLNIKPLSFPLIIKPADAAGSRGITKIEKGQSLTQNAFDHAFVHSKSKKVIIEEYINGVEYTAEVFADNGKIFILALTEKKKVEGTNATVAVELASPQKYVTLMEKASATLIDAFKAIGLTDGPGHAEFIIANEGKIYLVEAAGRGGGFGVFDRLVPAISGVDVAKATVLNACGLPVDYILSRRYAKPKAAVLRFFPSVEGTLTDISGFDDANSIVGIEAKPFVKINHKMRKAMTDGDRLGYILATGNDIVEAQIKTNRAEKMINFEVTPHEDH
jgi:biotin carboxylase